MKIGLSSDFLEKYPTAQIGYLNAEVSVTKVCCYVDALKADLKKHLEQQGVNSTNFAIHPALSLWRAIYEDHFQVKAKTYRSSLEALVKRVVTGKELWNICSVVDLYNCCSIFAMLPMGGYDLDKISGEIQVRFGKAGETFLALGEREPVEVQPHHVVYSDQEKILCWLWNHKDSRETCIDENTKRVLFFIDGFDRAKVQNALNLLAEHLVNGGCDPLKRGILDKREPCLLC